MKETDKTSFFKSSASEPIVMTNEILSDDEDITPFIVTQVCDHVSSVPEDLLMYIFTYLEFPEIIHSISLVNSTFYNCSKSDVVWRQFIRYEKNLKGENDNKTWDEITPQEKSVTRKRVFERTNSYSLFEIFKYEYNIQHKGWYNFRGYRVNEKETANNPIPGPNKMRFETDFFDNHKSKLVSLTKNSQIPQDDLGFNYLTFHRSCNDMDTLHLVTCSHVVRFFDINLNSHAIEDDSVSFVQNMELKQEWVETYEMRSLMWCVDYQQHRIPNVILTGGFSSNIFMGQYFADDEIPIKSTLTIPHGHKNGIWNLKIINDKQFVTGGADGVAKIFDVETQKEVHQLICDSNGVSTHKSAIYDVDCNSSGKYCDLFVTASADKFIKVFDARASTLIGEVNTDSFLYELNVQCLDPSAGKYTFLAGSDRGFIQMMDFRKISQTAPTTGADPCIMYDMDVFRLGAIRGLLYDGQKIVVGSKLGVVVITDDPVVKAKNEPKIAQASHINDFIRPQMMIGDVTNPCPWRVVNFMPVNGIMSLEMDEEILIGGTVANDLLIGHCPSTHEPFSRSEQFQNTSKCTIQ